MPVAKAGLLRVHGPLGNRYAGSGMSTFSPAGASASAGASFSDDACSGDADVGINGESVRDTNTRCARCHRESGIAGNLASPSNTP